MATSTYSTHSAGITERRLQIPEFHGVDQSRGLYSNDIASSPDAVNFITQNGTIRTAGGVAQYGGALTFTNQTYTSESKPRLFQAFFRDASGNDVWKLMASFNRSLYVYDTAATTWSIVGSTAADGCDMVNYRNESTDWAIFTDGTGLVYYWDGTAATTSALTPAQGAVTIHFQQIALIYERLFGAVYKDVPDRLYWSEDFDPTNWEPDATTAEDGGGFLDVATFDGSRIRAIVPAFGDMLIFKDKSVHKVVGSYPGEWQLSQIFGNQGTLSPRSIVNTGTAVYFLCSDGLCKYDGSTVYTLKATGDKKLKDVWALLNATAIENACAAYFNNVIYLAVSLDEDESRNTHVIEYDTVEHTYSVVEVAGIDDWLVLRDGQKETLLAIVWDKVYQYDSGATFFGEAIDAVWTSPEFLGLTSASKKQSGTVYITVEGTSLDAARDSAIKLSMLSGDTVRSRIIALKAGVQVIKKRVRAKGRALRFRIENQNGDPLTIHRGFEILIEEDLE